MPVSQNLPGYYKSFSLELKATQDRVRNIIGSGHWGMDGAHKELILQDVLRRFLPETVCVTSGFVIGADGRCSRQIDVMLYDKQSPTLFKTSGFTIIPAKYLRAVVEVKTNLSPRSTLDDALENLFSVQSIVGDTGQVHYSVFSFSDGGYHEWRHSTHAARNLLDAAGVFTDGKLQSGMEVQSHF